MARRRSGIVPKANPGCHSYAGAFEYNEANWIQFDVSKSGIGVKYRSFIETKAAPFAHREAVSIPRAASFHCTGATYMAG
jgi:hypothetical protein